MSIVVELELLAVELEGGGVHLALREQFVDFAGLGVGEADERLLRAPQVERRRVPLHRLLQAFDVAVDIAVEQRQEEAEVLWVALVRRRRHQQDSARSSPRAISPSL